MCDKVLNIKKIDKNEWKEFQEYKKGIEILENFKLSEKDHELMYGDKKEHEIKFPEIKPPLGLKPRNIFEKQMTENINFNNKTRLFDILQASLRYLENNLKIPMIWLDEALQINLDLDLSVLEPEKIEVKIDKEDSFNPLNCGFILDKINNDSTIWQKIRNNTTFILYKLNGTSEEIKKPLWKILKYTKNTLIPDNSGLILDKKNEIISILKEIGAI